MAASPGAVRQVRLRVASAAYAGGYFLLDCLTLPHDDAEAAGTLARLRDVVVATAAEALFVCGPVDLAVLEEMAAELRLVLHCLEPVAPGGRIVRYDHLLRGTGE